MSTSPNISVRPEYTEKELREKAAAFDQRFGNNAYEFLNGREQQIRQDMRGLFPEDSIDSAIREERERSIGTPGEVHTYRFLARTTDGREIEQMVAASNVDAAGRQSWDVIQERDRNGVQIASAKLEWEDKQEGPQVEYLYNRKQGIEINRPPGITLSHEVEVQREWRADDHRRQQWNGLIEGGTVSANAPERSMQDLKPPAEMTKPEIVTEARAIHAQFTQLMERYEGTPSGPERSQLREEMKPLVLRENELREEYTGRVKAEMNPVELSQDRVPEQSIGYAR